MANNIHISYDLIAPGKNYETIIAAIKALSGNWAKIHYSFWFVSTGLTAQQVFDRLSPLLDASDSLYVVDAKNNVAAWRGLSKDVSDHIIAYWSH